MPLLNFALNPGGYLFLGKSEGIGGRSDLFDMVSKKARLYRRLDAGPPHRPGFADFAGPEENDADRSAGRAQAAGGRLYGRDPAGPVEPLFRQRRVGGPEGTDSSVPRPNRQVPQHADGRAQA